MRICWMKHQGSRSCFLALLFSLNVNNLSGGQMAGSKKLLKVVTMLCLFAFNYIFIYRYQVIIKSRFLLIFLISHQNMFFYTVGKESEARKNDENQKKVYFASQRKYNPTLKTNMFFCNLFASVYVEWEISIFGFSTFILKRDRLGSII